MNFRRAFRRLLVGEGGLTSVEYGLIAGALVLSLFAASTALRAAQAAAYKAQHDGLKTWRAP